MTKKFNLVAAGRAYTDIFAHVSTDFLQTHAIPLDGQRECSTAELKQFLESLSRPQMLAGGSAANTAAMLAAAGGKAGFFAKVYDDEAGKNFLNDFTQRNIDLCCPAYAQDTQASAVCLVFLTEADRSFAYNPGCADEFSIADFERFDFSTTDFFLIEAHLLTSSAAKSALMHAMKRAEDKCAIVINLQGISEWDDFADVLRAIAGKASIIFGNEKEQVDFMQALYAHKLSLRESQFLVTTLGLEGAEVSRFGQPAYHVPAQTPSKFENASGAGDAFIAGFLLARSRDMAVEESMQYAVTAATAVLEEEGARPTRPLAHLFPA